MKNLTLVFSLLCSLFSFATTTAPIIFTPIENTSSEQVSHQLNLDNLKINVLYKITCDIKNTNENAKILFEPHLLATTNYGDIKLNEQTFSNNSGNLKPNNNEFSFRMLINKEDINQYNKFTLSSNSATPIQINQCRAIESLPTDNQLKLNKTMATAALSGDFFFAFNDTDHLIHISVGTFFPVSYRIEPNDYRVIFVSTDNQNIRITKVD